MGQLTTAGIHHVALATGALERALPFYRDALGLRPLQPGNAGEDGVVLLGDGAGGPGSMVALREVPGAAPGRPGIGGIHHTAWGVDGDDALLRWKRRLTDLGVPVSGPYDRGYFTSIYFRDPDGQVLEIATSGPGYTVDEAADALGRELVLPPQRIVRGHRDEAAIAALTHDEPVPRITEDMALQGIHHVSGITDDLAAAGEFYEQGLGLKLIKKTTNRDDPQQLHYFWANHVDGAVAPHSSFTLFGWPRHWNRARTGPGQTQHVAFHTAGADDLPRWQDHLQSLGTHVTRADGRLHFRAPDGLLLEIVPGEDHER